MPFTLAHPAAVLPLWRLCPERLVWSALVIGSMTPDFEYFVTLRMVAVHGNTLAGSFYFCAPAGLAVFVLFHGLVKRPLVQMLPDRLRLAHGAAAQSGLPPRARTWALVTLSILLGAWTHQLWDSFSHAGRWGTRHVASLNSELFSLGDVGVRGYKLVQFGGGVLGLAFLGAAYLHWLHRASPAGEPPPRLRTAWRRGLLVVTLATPALLAILVGAQGTAGSDGVSALHRFAVRATASGVAATAAMVVLLSLLVRVFESRLREARDEPA